MRNGRQSGDYMSGAGTTTAVISAFTISLFGLQQCSIQVPQQAISVITDNSTTPTPTPTSPATPALTTAQFIAMASAGTGTTTLLSRPDTFTFSGCLAKQKTADRRVLGAAAFLTNESGSEYRITKFSYVLDSTRLQSGEAVESDVGFTILPKTEVVALNSGEETLITHQYDAAPLDRGVTDVALPAGGIALPANFRLSPGSVSGTFLQAGGGAFELPDARIADGKFMQTCYSIELVRADLVPTEKAVSYRSPFRDRAYVADPSRTTAPFTNFKNTSGHAVRVYGVAAFIANLTDSEPSEHETNVYVNGVLKARIAHLPHVPGTSTPREPIISPVDLVLAPGDVVSVRGKVTPKRAIVFDYASFFYAQDGLTPVDERFNVLNADLNGDGLTDILDIDSLGSVWVSLRVGAGLQDTQSEWARSLRNADSLTLLPRAAASDPIVVQATNAAGLCLNMTSVPRLGRFVLDYCRNNVGASTEADYWGDFNGDGWIDRLRIDSGNLAYLVALGGPGGLTTQTSWLNGYGSVDRLFVSDSNGDGKDDFESEWFDGRFRCMIWPSTGTAFTVSQCS